MIQFSADTRKAYKAHTSDFEWHDGLYKIVNRDIAAFVSYHDLRPLSITPKGQKIYEAKFIHCKYRPAFFEVDNDKGVVIHVNNPPFLHNKVAWVRDKKQYNFLSKNFINGYFCEKPVPEEIDLYSLVWEFCVYKHHTDVLQFCDLLGNEPFGLPYSIAKSKAKIEELKKSIYFPYFFDL